MTHETAEYGPGAGPERLPAGAPASPRSRGTGVATALTQVCQPPRRPSASGLTPSSTIGPRLLTPTDVAEHCQISTKTVLRAIQSGRLRASRLGSRGAYRMRVEDVDEWLCSAAFPCGCGTRATF